MKAQGGDHPIHQRLPFSQVRHDEPPVHHVVAVRLDPGGHVEHPVLDILQPRPPGLSPGGVELHRIEIESQDVPVRPDPLGHRAAHVPGAAADIHRGHSRPDAGGVEQRLGGRAHHLGQEIEAAGPVLAAPKGIRSGHHDDSIPSLWSGRTLGSACTDS